MNYSFAQQIGRWVKHGRVPHTGLRALLLVLLTVWCAYSLLQLTLVLSGQSQPAPLAAEFHRAATESNNTGALALTKEELQRLKSYPLFGKLAVKRGMSKEDRRPAVSEAELNATRTKLDLRLLGLVYAPDQSQTLAVIAHKNRQEQYRVGAELPVSGRVELSRVLHNRVIIANNGRYESLWLYDEDKPATGFVAATATPTPESEPESVDGQQDRVAPKNGKTAAQIAQDYRQRLYRDPTSLAEAIRISPVEQGGEMIGYRIAPGRNPAEFAQLGFKPRDIVTSINNIQLNSPGKALLLYRQMRNAGEANLTIKRGGETLELLLALDGGNS